MIEIKCQNCGGMNTLKVTNNSATAIANSNTTFTKVDFDFNDIAKFLM